MSDNQSKSNNEIDLLELFSAMWRGIGNFFKAIIDAVLFLFVFGIRRIHWLACIVLIGALIGFVRFRSTDRIYSSEMIAQPNGFTSVDMAQYINDIHEMCERNNYEGIADAFNISAKNAESITNIEAYHFIDVNGDDIGDHVDYKQQFSPLDTTKSIIMNRILIRAEVLDNILFNEVKKGLINYIDSNAYLMTVNELRQMELETLIAQTDAEISKLDSLQDFEYYKQFGDGSVNREGQIVFMNEKQTQLYYKDKVSLLRTRLAYEKLYSLATDPITIIKDFSSLQIEDNPISKYVIKNGFIMGLIGYFAMLILAYRKKIYSFLVSKG